jgi:2-phosphosulfolactate phosphatase
MTWSTHCEWGTSNLASLADPHDVVVIVDVLSFSTCVEIAVSRGAAILPFPWKDNRAAGYALAHEAELAGTRGVARFSLSPASFLGTSPGARVVLPSPNGAALSLAARAPLVLAGCLRNATAVARAARAAGGRVLVVAAGERWPDDSLRPAIEDWWGAGAIVNALAGPFSPEADAAREAFRAVARRLPVALRECVSGQELIERGFKDDVPLAAALDVSEAVPELHDRVYRRLGSGS